MSLNLLSEDMSQLDLDGACDGAREHPINEENADETVPSLVQALFDPYVHYLKLFSRHNGNTTASSISNEADVHKLRVAPLFSSLVHEKAQHLSTFTTQVDDVFPHYGLLGLIGNVKPPITGSLNPVSKPEQQIVFSNTTEPWSTFICGSQGSGKSHTLSCLLENNLIKEPKIGKLDKPLAGIVFHYDKFSNFNSGQVCEAAYLCSAGVKVKVLVAPTSLSRMHKQYTNLPNLPPKCTRPKVLPLVFGQEQLSVDTMMTLMAVHDTGVAAPLYICAIRQLLREIAETNQDKKGFNYLEFRERLALLPLTDAQNAPLEMRLQLLQSVMITETQTPKALKAFRETWSFEPGTLTIVDLSDQFVNESDACALFSIVLKLFMDGWQKSPRIIGLDEAHKFLNSTAEAMQLTIDLIAIIRQQRHLASRVVIATQEPTVSGELLDLCNVSIVHRFNSPKWFQTIKQHLAGASTQTHSGDSLFTEIVKLSTGEALVFCPTAVLSMKSGRPQSLQDGYVKISIRDRISADGGASVRSSHATTQRHTASVPQAPSYQRFNADNLPPLGNQARPRIRPQFNPIAAYAALPNGPSGGSTSSSTMMTRSHSATSNGVKRARPAYNGTADTNDKTTKTKDADSTQEPDIAQHSSPGLVLAVMHKHIRITEVELEQYMYAEVKRILGEKVVNPSIKDPGSYIGEILEKVGVKYGLERDYLKKHDLRGGCEDRNPKAMLKRLMKRYYDTKGVSMKKRPQFKWLLD